ncbi:MAG: hypothetical protein SH850_22310 [Planctomycetaceae bacterium]|nr:hypothetical protein [Planctomycetaceae bacterium]
MTTQQPASRWKLFAFVVIAALTVTYLFAIFNPWLAFLSGIAILACGAAFAAWPPLSQSIARWRQIPLPTARTRIYLGTPIACYGVILLAISQSQIRANWREADVRAEIARELNKANSAIEQKHAEEALKICASLESKANSDEKAKISAIRNRAQDVERARQVRSANDQVLRLVSDGQTFLINRELDNAQSSLNAALHVPLATLFSTANEFADQIASARTKLAAAHLEKGDMSAAKKELKRAISVPKAKSTA